MITLHHLASEYNAEQSRSQRILWLLEELNVPYQLKEYKRLASGAADPELKKIHPLGKSPIITDDDLTIAESGAIVQYLIKKYGNGRFVPEAGTQKELDDIYFQHFAEGTLMPYMVMKLIFGKLYDASPFFIKPISGMLGSQVGKSYIEPNVKKSFLMIAEYLEKDGGRQWLAGGSEPTGADFMMSFPLEASILGGRMPEESIPQALRTYVERIHARPAYKQAIAKGPKYNYGPREGKL